MRDLVRKVEYAGQRRHIDTRISVQLTPSMDAPTAGAMFTATISHQYYIDTAAIHEPQAFTCVDNRDDYNVLRRNGGQAWHFPAVGELHANDPGVFSLTEYLIDDVPQSIARDAEPGRQTYTVTLSPQALTGEGRRRISYTYKTLIAKHGHMLWLDIDSITKALQVSFSHYDCGISYINARPFFGDDETRLAYNAPSPTSGGFTAEYPGRIMPPATGIAVGWTLESEL